MGFKIGDFAEDVGPSGLIAGIGAAILAPLVIPALANIGKPLAKTAVKGGLVFYEKTKEVFAEAGELFEDIVAESRAELAEEKATTTVDSHHEVTIDD
jgi:hypothetical protein